METGTLEQIGAMDGDKVFCISNIIDLSDADSYEMFTPGKCYTFASRGMTGDNDALWPGVHPYCGVWRIISRAAQPTPDLTAITTPFGLLDAATQEALRAHGGPYEWYASNGWQHVAINDFEDHMTYRLQPEATVENVSIDAWIGDSGGVYVTRLHEGTPVRVTFNRNNGLMDLASYKVEPR